MFFVCSVDVLHSVVLGIFLFIYFSFVGRGIIEFIGWLFVCGIAVRLSLPVVVKTLPFGTGWFGVSINGALFALG